MKLYLARHGQTHENHQQILQGQMPGHLNDEGEAQAQQLSRQLEDVTFQGIVSSDLNRCRQTTSILNAERRLDVCFTPLLRERDWGDWTGVPIREAVGKEVPLNAENIPALQQRALQFLQWVWAHYAQTDTLLVVSHGFFIRIILSVWQQMDYHKVPRMENAECRAITVDEHRLNHLVQDVFPTSSSTSSSTSFSPSTDRMGNVEA